MLKKIFIVLALLIISSNTNANINDKSLYVLGYSYHLITKGLNQENYLLALEYNNFIFGGFINSYNDPTIIGLYKFNYNYNVINYGFMVGASFGYDCDNLKGLTPCYKKLSGSVMPYVEYDVYKVKPVISIFGEAIFLTIRIPF